MSETDQDSEISDIRDIEGFEKLNKSKQEEIEAKFREQKKVIRIRKNIFYNYSDQMNFDPQFFYFFSS